MIKRENFIHYFGFNDTWLRLIGIPLAAFVIPIIFFGVEPDNFQLLIKHVMVGLIYTTIHWHVDIYIVYYFRKLYSDYKQYRKRLILQSLTVFSFTLLYAIINGIFIQFSPQEMLLPEERPTSLQIIYASLTTTVIVGAIYEGVYAFSRWGAYKVESERLKKEHLNAQLKALKNQINPHFLFNSLNTLTSMIPDDPDEAVHFVQKLSKVYRYVLQIKHDELITLREELECIESYQFLLESRFGENLHISIDIPEDKKDYYVVPLALQMLIENAIKHNIISNTKPLYIDVGLSRKGDLVVSNNLQRKKQGIESTKTGLQNIKTRYEIISNRKVEVIASQEHYWVILPLLKIEPYASTDH